MGRFVGTFFLYMAAAFAAMILGIAGLIPVALGLTLFAVIVLWAVASMIRTSSRTRKGYPELMDMTDARSGTAEILEADEFPMFMYMGEAEYPPRLYRLKLRVTLPGSSPYETMHYTAAHPWMTNHLLPGNSWPIWVHPKKPKRMHLLFGDGRGREPGNARTVTFEASDHSSVPKEASDAVKAATGLDLGDLIQQAVAGKLDGTDLPPTIDVELPDQVIVTNTRLDLIEQGLDGTARVTAVRDLGLASAAGTIVELDLEVTRSGGQPYPAVLKAEFAAATMPRPGETVSVKIDPDRPGRVLILGESGASW